jgi:hypothetical protein
VSLIARSLGETKHPEKEGPNLLCHRAQNEPAKISNLNRCCDYYHCKRKPPGAVVMSQTVCGNYGARETNRWNKDDQFEAQSKHRSDKNADYQEAQHMAVLERGLHRDRSFMLLGPTLTYVNHFLCRPNLPLQSGSPKEEQKSLEHFAFGGCMRA